MSTIRVFFLANLLALAMTVTAQAQSQPRFQCWGSYTNIFQAPQSGDPSGIEVFILSRSEVFVVVGEGHVIGTKARNISISGNKIAFDYWQNKFSAVCRANGLRYAGFSATNECGIERNAVSTDATTINAKDGFHNPVHIAGAAEKFKSALFDKQFQRLLIFSTYLLISIHFHGEVVAVSASQQLIEASV